LNRETTIGRKHGGGGDSELRAFNETETGAREMGPPPGQEQSSASFDPVETKELTTFSWPIYV
jgi:hypothetical protein